MFNPKPKSEVKAAFIGEVTKNATTRSYPFPLVGDELGEFVANYLNMQWHYVEAVYDAGHITGLNGGASDFTCDFCCRLLANRV